MRRWLGFTALAAAAAMFLVLPRGGADVTVAMVGDEGTYAFDPSSFDLDPGDRVVFRNDTRATHTATCDDCPADSGDVQPGESVIVTLPNRGAFTFYCRYHGTQGMTARARVGSGPVSGTTPEPNPTGP